MWEPPQRGESGSIQAPPPSRRARLREDLGAERIARVLEVDQTPIGKTPRSCPATYVGFLGRHPSVVCGHARGEDARLHTGSVLIQRRRWSLRGMRGQGVKKIEMSFLPDVAVTCEACRGKRFAPETLEVKWKDKSIGEVLAMSVDEAVAIASRAPTHSPRPEAAGGSRPGLSHTAIHRLPAIISWLGWSCCVR